MEQESVDKLFEHILTKLVDDLPAMDSQALEYVSSVEIGSTLERYGNCKRNLLICCNRIYKTIPLEASYLAKEADKLSRRLISQLSSLRSVDTRISIGKAPLRRDTSNLLKRFSSKTSKS